MEFVEDHQADALQRRVVLQAPGEDAFGHHLDAGARADLRLQADAVAHPLADALAQLGGQALGGGAGGQPARLQHEDGLPGEPGLVQQGKGTRVVLPAPGGASSTASWRPASASRRAGSTASMGSGFMGAPTQGGDYSGEPPALSCGLRCASGFAPNALV